MAFPSRFRRFFLAALRASVLAASAVVLLAPVPVAAQEGSATVTVAQTITRRDDRRSGVDPETITYGDCIYDGEGEEIEFGITVTGTGLAGASLEIWAGTSENCDQEDERGRLTPTSCWQVWSGETTERTAIVRAVDIIPHGATGQGSGTVAGCDNPSLSDDSLTLYFMVLDGSDLLGSAERGFKYDLTGPEAPELKSIGAGEGRLVAKWEGSEDEEIAGYRIYCEPSAPPAQTQNTLVAEQQQQQQEAGAGGTAGAAGASGSGGTGGGTGMTGSSGTGGASGTAGTGGAAGTAGAGIGTPSPTCPAPTLRAGTRPPNALHRGTAARTAEQGPATGLENFEKYACGVAAYDQDENIGVLSAVLCGTPEPVIDYFEAYRRAGGKAGGGYCAFGRSPGELAATAFGLSALAIALRRRSRRGGV